MFTHQAAIDRSQDQFSLFHELSVLERSIAVRRACRTAPLKENRKSKKNFFEKRGPQCSSLPVLGKKVNVSYTRDYNEDIHEKIESKSALLKICTKRFLLHHYPIYQ